MRLLLKVVPGASRDRIAGWVEDRLKACVAAAPERGRANRAVEALLAKTLGLRVSQVRIVAGGSSPRKAAEIDAPESAVFPRLPPR